MAGNFINKISEQKQIPRLRVFAGPNGSGKSTVIRHVKNYKLKENKTIDFGYYINADDIAVCLAKNMFSFAEYGLDVSNKNFVGVAMSSGLVYEEFTEETFKASYLLRSNKIKLKNEAAKERLAQIIADFLRKELLARNEKFSFETVFSHPSKIDIIREAAEKGYKVYLYFVSTESPEINKFRVKARTRDGGHDVPLDKIESRYYRSLDLLHDACKHVYQAFFFDNSYDGEKFKMFAHFKRIQHEEKWDQIVGIKMPKWFKRYYSAKQVPSRKKK